MNRALLLVICDFLILSLLALANFDTAGLDGQEEVEQVAEAENVQSEQDLLEALKLSLEEERASREELSGDLDLTQQALLEREESLAEREARLEALAADLENREAERQQLERERAALEEKVTEVAEDRARQEEEARRARERALEVERELSAKLAELEKSQETLVRLEARQREAEEANRNLASQLEVSDAEKRLIRENLDHVRSEVTLVRQEKERVEERARELAQGVGTLAERSGELAEEVRRSQPKTPNTLFSDFQTNQVKADFRRARTRGLITEIDRQSETRSVLVTDGEKIYALFHIENTGLSLKEAVDWERVLGSVSASGEVMPVGAINFLSLDPRIVAVEIDQATAEKFQTRIYQLARDPFRFPEAVLINSGGNYYGESSFTLDADQPRYVQMPKRIWSRRSGEFSPSSGDLVFSKTEELIGIMVNEEYCALIDNLLLIPDLHLQLGVDPPATGPILTRLKQRVDRLPPTLRQL